MPVPKPKDNEEHDGKTGEEGAIERRRMPMEAAELHASDGDQPKLAGYAAKYGILTDLGWFREKIKAGAFDEALKTSDARCLKNHDVNLLLGRESSGTLRLASNTVGLHFEVDLPDTTTGRDTREEVLRRDLQGCSFSFTVAEDVWVNKEDGTQERTITKIGQLFDVGPVTFPAYEDTTVAARSLAAFQKTNQPAVVPAGSGEISRQRQREVQYQYEEMGRILHACRSPE
jgi:uncharacterized protein